MKTLVIGATGLVGSAIGRTLSGRGYDLHGLARSPASIARLEQTGVTPVPGSIEQLDELCGTVKAFDLLILSAMVPFDVERRAVAALLDACRGSSRHLIFTSGTGVLAIEARGGEWDDNSFAEDDPFPFPSRPNRTVRLKTEEMVRAAARDGLHTTVIRPPLIYGHGGSVQIPRLFESAARTGKVCYLERGLNLYSNVHVDDLAEVFALAVERGVPGALYHAVAGEANFRTLAEAVGSVVECGTQSLNYDEACELWGKFWVDHGLAVNSRSRAPRTRSELGWTPRNVDIVEEIRSGSYRDAYHAWKDGTGEALKISSHG